MQPRKLSRREFAAATAGGTIAAATRGRAQTREITAQAIADRIRSRIGVPWRENTPDGFKAGDPATAVNGVAAIVMPTIETLRRAAAAKRNLIVALEPTFYSGDDRIGNRAMDVVYLAKKQLIDDQRLVIWRIADHWHARQPSEAVKALASELGWTSTLAGTDAVFQIPPTTLGALTTRVRAALGVRGGIRTVGDSSMRVGTVFISPGTTDLANTMANLRHADVVLAGEPREWEAVPYALDTWSALPAQGKGLLALGRVVSEGPSMRACADWIRTLVTEVPVDLIATTDPYWSPVL